MWPFGRSDGDDDIIKDVQVRCRRELDDERDVKQFVDEVVFPDGDSERVTYTSKREESGVLVYRRCDGVSWSKRFGSWSLNTNEEKHKLYSLHSIREVREGVDTDVQTMSAEKDHEWTAWLSDLDPEQYQYIVGLVDDGGKD